MSVSVDAELLIKGILMNALHGLEKVFAGMHHYGPPKLPIADYLGWGPVYGKQLQDNVKTQFPHWDEVFDFLDSEGIDVADEREYYERIRDVDSKMWTFKLEAVAR